MPRVAFHMKSLEIYTSRSTAVYHLLCMVQ
jgi:hypothetical protein